MLKWMGPMEEMPPNLGWVTPIGGCGIQDAGLELPES